MQNPNIYKPDANYVKDIPSFYARIFNSDNKINSEEIFKEDKFYLSDHNCGTEFYNGCMVKSVKGRSLLFPPYWTHAHKGQPCPDNKERYILSAYGVFNKP